MVRHTVLTLSALSFSASFKRAVFEGEFEALLKKLTPTPALMNAASAMLKDLWEHKENYGQQRKRVLKKSLVKKEREIEKLLSRIVDTNIDSVMKTYEAKIQSIEQEKLVIMEKLEKSVRPKIGYSKIYRTAMNFLREPYKLRASGSYEHQRAVLKLVFAQRLVFDREKGYRTAKNTLPFNMLGGVWGLGWWAL